MILFPHAKINLGLNVVSRRTDGFHNIETIFYPVDLTDNLEFVIAPDNKTKFSNSGIKIDNNKNNLCLKAYNLLKEKHDLPSLHIHLDKIIPVGAGLGGGSSDAASMIKGLNDFFKLGLSVNEMSQYSSVLGSDCPFFIYNKPLHAKGKGDILTDINLTLKGYYIYLVYPNILVSTKDAYSGVQPATPDLSLNDIIRKPVVQWKDIIKNDFEISVFKSFPVIGEIKEKLYQKGALYASMSGSGSSVYGIFDYKPEFHDFDQNYFIWDGTL